MPSGLSEADRERLDQVVKRGRPMQRAEHLFRQGERMTALYAVRSGSLKGYTTLQDGAEQIVRFYLPGEVIGLDALDGERHTSSAVALETASVCRIGFEHLEEMGRQMPSLSYHLLRLTGREVAAEHDRTLLLGQKAAEERLAAFLVSMSEQFRRRGYSEREFNLSMSRQEIANFLALAVETVSRLFTNLQNAGILSVDRRHVSIHALDRLRAMVGHGRMSAVM